MTKIPFNPKPVANSELRPHGDFKARAEDFVVTEDLDFEPADEGEHILLKLRKRNFTTREVQLQLAKALNLQPMQIGYAGLKDKRSIATQWFSVHAPEVDLRRLCGFDVLEQRRHQRKLRGHDVLRNHFEITIRSVNAEILSLEHVKNVPNYFGAQRFGRDGQNVANALAWVDQGKPQISGFLKSLHISSLRSELFNTVLAERVSSHNWRTGIDGDVFVDGLPTGPLWGRGRSAATATAKAIEERALCEYSTIKDALEWVGLKHERRVFALRPEYIELERSKSDVRISFALPRGTYATSVLRELFDLNGNA